MRQNKKIWMGIILIIIGMLFIIKKYFNFSFSAMIWLILGLSFFVLYKNKGKKWALIPSGYFFYLGIILILNAFGINTFLLTVDSFFIVPGIVFIILFFDKKNILFLRCACVFLSIGIFIILNRILKIPLIGIVCICAGFCFVLSSVFKKIEKDQ